MDSSHGAFPLSSRCAPSSRRSSCGTWRSLRVEGRARAACGASGCNASNASAAYALLEEELLHISEESLSRFIAGATREEEASRCSRHPVPGERAAASAAAGRRRRGRVPARHPSFAARRVQARLQSGRHGNSCESFCVAKFFRAHCSRCKCRGCDFCPPPPTAPSTTASAPAARRRRTRRRSSRRRRSPVAQRDRPGRRRRRRRSSSSSSAVVAAIANVTAPLTAAATAAAALAPPANATPAAEPPRQWRRRCATASSRCGAGLKLSDYTRVTLRLGAKSRLVEHNSDRTGSRARLTLS